MPAAASTRRRDRLPVIPRQRPMPRLHRQRPHVRRPRLRPEPHRRIPANGHRHPERTQPDQRPVTLSPTGLQAYAVKDMTMMRGWDEVERELFPAGGEEKVQTLEDQMRGGRWTRRF